MAKSFPIIRVVLFSVLMCATLLSAGIWALGDVLIHPSPAAIGSPPADLPVHPITFRSTSGADIHGWFVPGDGAGAVLLLHGVRANRLSMLPRARFLHAAGYSVMLIDFQSSGESTGDAITFGFLESRDAAGALTELKRLAPDQRVGIIGTSMGGAAVLLAEPRLEVDAMVLEQVYPTLSNALDDRLALHAGKAGQWLAPLLAVTVKPHLGFAVGQLRPIDHIRRIHPPKLIVAGDADEHTRLGETIAMYQAAAPPKALWVIRGARHVDLYRYSGKPYETRILAFLQRWLRPGSPARDPAEIENR